MRVLVVDDHPVVREGVCSLIRSQPDMTVIGVAGTAAAAMQALASATPEVVVLDIGLPDTKGTSLISEIIQRHPAARILMLTVNEAAGSIRRAIEAGALGYLLKDSVGEELIEAIRAVASGERYLSKRAAGRLADSIAKTGLTEREFSVLQHLGEGLSNKEIALRMNIGEQTVKTHVRGVLDKLGAKDRLEAVVRAAREGLIELR